jgi:hypothetical protein
MHEMKNQNHFIIHSLSYWGDLVAKTASIALLVALCVNTAYAAAGDTTVARWKYNTRGAFTMSFDDSMETHASTAMPAIIERGLIGTWFINPGVGRHQRNKQIWEVDGPKSGQEYANHTWVHRGARSYQEADFQIGACARYIWKLRGPGASKLQAFTRGGGTTWSISNTQMQELRKKYHCITRTSELSARTDLGVNGYNLVSKAHEAIKQGRWVPIHFHGIGGEWLSIDTGSFIQLLDFLADNKDRLWSAGWSAAYQYIKERDNADIDVLKQSNSSLRVRISTGMNPELYAEPLTLITEVPPEWSEVEVAQNGRSKTHRAKDGNLLYEAIPDRGDIMLQARSKGQ